MDLDTAQLRSFMAVVRYGGYHRAAGALHLTQPAISRHMRRLEEQLGRPLFRRRGRGVELTEFGERAAIELGAVLVAHDQALTRLARPDGDGPFMFGCIENLFDPVLPDLISLVRDRLTRPGTDKERPLQLRVDRSGDLYHRYLAGELDAAIVFDAHDHPDAVELGTLTLWWWTATDHPLGDPLPDPFPLVAYDAPCSMRELALGQLAGLGLEVQLVAEAPHLTGVQAAARNGLGAALMAYGGDGLRRVSRGPLAAPRQARLWLLAGERDRVVATDLRRALGAHTSPLAPPLTAVA